MRPPEGGRTDLGSILSPITSAPLASRSSVRLASDPTLAGVTGTYVDTNGRPTAWPGCALDERNREVIWSLCERLSGVPAS
jgi:hypothetical protein